MKIVYQSLFLLVTASPIAVAAPASALQNKPVVRDLTRPITPVREPLKPLTKPVENVNKELNTLTQDTSDILVNAAGQLPKQLPILDKQGNTLFVETEVENGFRAIAREWMISVSSDELADFHLPFMDIIERNDYPSLNLHVIRFRVPSEWDSREALATQLSEALMTQLDRNHVYATQNVPTPTKITSTLPATTYHTPAQACDASMRVGMIDTAVQLNHPAFGEGRIIAQQFLPNVADAPNAHGTAVAGVLIGKSAELLPLLPKATIYSAAIFYARNEISQGATTQHLLQALAWLVQEKVLVINMSLTGPANRLLHQGIQAAHKRGVGLVAAVGNEGPTAAPLFPAAYPEAIAVTAVDASELIYRWANRGEHVTFAAPGVSVFTARANDGFGVETGTSMAAPVVSAFMACDRAQHDDSLINTTNRLASQAKDLGEPGRDPIYGFGLLKPNTKP